MNCLRLWTQITLNAILLLLFGCTTPKPVVWVDENAVLQYLTARDDIAESAIPSEFISKPEGNAILEGKHDYVSVRTTTEERKKDAVFLIEQETKKIQQELQSVYLRRFLAEAEASEKRLIDELAFTSRERTTEFIESISDYIKREALDYGMLKVRLSLLDGGGAIPKRPSPEMLRRSTVERARVEESKRIREKISALDAKFEEYLAVRIAQFHTASELESQRMKLLMQDLRDTAYRNAERAVETHIRETGRTEVFTLLEPAEEIVIPIESKEIKWGGLTFYTGIDTGEETRQKESPNISTLLNIWVSVKGYKLSASPKGAENKTKEFINWLTTR